MLPQLFEQPYKEKGGLNRIRHKVDGLLQQSAKVRGTTAMFLVAFRLEFHILHPALISLLNFLETLPNQESALAEYRSHLGLFINALNGHGLTKPEFKLLGETIDRLWKDNSNLAVMSNADSLTGIYNRRGMFDALLPLIYLAQRKKLPRLEAGLRRDYAE